MSTKISAEVVNAFVDPVVEVLRTFIGIEAQPAGIAMTRQIDPPPSLVCTIEMTGRLAGPITWVFSEEMARLFASRLLATDDAADALEGALCDDAVTELANIICGNATGLLQAAGYPVEIHPPRVYKPGDADLELAEQAVSVWLESEVGRVKVLIGVRIIEN